MGADFVNILTEVRGTIGEPPRFDTDGKLLNPIESGKYGSMVEMHQNVTGLSADVDMQYIRVNEQYEVIAGKDGNSGMAADITGKYNVLVGEDGKSGKIAEAMVAAEGITIVAEVLNENADVLDNINNDLISEDEEYHTSTSNIITVGSNIRKGTAESELLAVGSDLLKADEDSVLKVIAPDMGKITKVSVDIAKTGDDPEADDYSVINHAAENAKQAMLMADDAKMWAERDAEIGSGQYSSKVHAKNSARSAGESADYATASATSAEASAESAEEAKGYIDRVEALDLEANTLDSGVDATVKYDSSTGKMVLGLPRGMTGERGPGLEIDHHGKFSDRSSYDDEATGFIYLSLDGYGPIDEDTEGTNYEGTLDIAADTTLEWDGELKLHTDYMYKMVVTDMTAGSIKLKDGEHTIMTVAGNGEQVMSFRTRINELTLVADANYDGTLEISVREDLLQSPTVFFKNSNNDGDWTDGDSFSDGSTGPTGTSINGIAFTSTTDDSGDRGVVGATDTYTITTTDGLYYDFTVTNGNYYTDQEVVDVITDVEMEMTNKKIVDAGSEILAKHLQLDVQPTADVVLGDVMKITGYDLETKRVKTTKVSSIDDVAVGVMRADTLSGEAGILIVSDNLRGVDTADYEIGDTLYSNGLGGLTNVQAEGVYQKIGKVLTSDANGFIYVNCSTHENNSWDKIDLTKDVDKPVSTAVQAELDTKLNTDMLSTSGVLGVDDAKISSQKAIKTYVDSSIESIKSGVRYMGGYNASTGWPRLEPKTLTGTVDPDGTDTILGTDTLFSTELVVGDTLVIDGEERVVTDIESDTELTVDEAATDKASGQEVIRKTVEPSKGDIYTITHSGTFFDEEMNTGDLIFSEIALPATVDDWTILNRNISEKAIDIPVEPVGELTSVNVQDGLVELQGDIDGFGEVTDDHEERIASTETKVSDNTDAITENKNNIDLNRDDVETNASNIKDNEADISNNADAIKVNKDNIATHETRLDDQDDLDVEHTTKIATNTLKIAKNTKVCGTNGLERYDKILSSTDMIKMEYDADDNLSLIRYTDDGGDENPYYRDVLEYEEDNLVKIKHYYNTEDLDTESGKTVLRYTDGVLIATEYTEGE